MATITITVPNQILDRVVEALCNGVDSNSTKAKQEILSIIKSRVKAYEVEKSSRSAAATAAQDVDSNINIS